LGDGVAPKLEIFRGLLHSHSSLPRALAGGVFEDFDGKRSDASSVGTGVEGAGLRQGVLLSNDFVGEDATVNSPNAYRINGQTREFVQEVGVGQDFSGRRLNLRLFSLFANIKARCLFTTDLEPT
jgi:hypothetical protein